MVLRQLFRAMGICQLAAENWQQILLSAVSGSSALLTFLVRQNGQGE